MRIFVSFASEQSKTAESIYRKLLAAGYDVFFSSASIRAGQGYDERIRKAIIDADSVIFLASPDSLQGGCYTLTELEMIARKWEDPTGVVMTVLLGGSTYGDLPPYLGAVTSAIDPKGNVESEVVAAVIDVWPPDGGAGDERAMNLVGAILIVLLLALGSWMLIDAAGGISATPFSVENGLYTSHAQAPLDAMDDFCVAVSTEEQDWPRVYDLLGDDLRKLAAIEILHALYRMTGTGLVPDGVAGHELPTLPERDVASIKQGDEDKAALAGRLHDWAEPHLLNHKLFFSTGMQALAKGGTYFAAVREDLRKDDAPRGPSRSFLEFVAVHEPYEPTDMSVVRPDAKAVTCWGYLPRTTSRQRAARLEFRLRWVEAGWRVTGIQTELNREG